MAMREPDQQDFGFFEPRNHRLRRGVYLLPSAFTVGNLLCGFYAVLATVKGGIVDLDYAARAIGLAIVFDAFDGFVARATHTNTEFGKQFDSLADMVSFGVAPAILAYTWGVRTIAQSDIPEARHIYDLAWVVSTIRYASFKGIPWGKRQHSLTIVAVGLLVWSIMVYSEIVLLLIAASYTVAGLTIHVVRLVRHRLVSRTA